MWKAISSDEHCYFRNEEILAKVWEQSGRWQGEIFVPLPEEDGSQYTFAVLTGSLERAKREIEKQLRWVVK